MELKVNEPAGDSSREERLHAARRRMAELADRFLDRSGADLAAMRAALQGFETGDASGVADIRHLAHRMVGTGATLGFDSLSQCAQRIEKITENLAPGVLPDEPTRANLADGLAAMQSELGKLRG